MLKQDAVAYVRTNLEFHRTLYLRAQTPAMLALCETVVAATGADDAGRLCAPAAERGPAAPPDDPGRAEGRRRTRLRLAVRTDVTQGLRHLAG